MQIHSDEVIDLKLNEFKIFSEPFENEADALDKLSEFEALLIMRERTPITKNLIDNLINNDCSSNNFLLESKSSDIYLKAATNKNISFYF